MTKSFLAFIVILVLTMSGAFACLNGEHYQLADGSTLFTDVEGYSIPQGHEFYENELEYALVNLDSLWKQTHDVKYLSDYALVLIIKKRYEEAEKIYHQIEKDFPGRYSTASNLGTLYELVGQNEKALQWISKAVEIDPTSHMNSEWLHVNILKAKLAGEKAYNATFLLGTEFGEYNAPSSNLSSVELRDLQFALYFQLQERMSFISPPDKIMGVLLASLADVLWLNANQHDAAKVYAKSLAFEPNVALVAERLKRAQEKRLEINTGPRPVKQEYTFLYVGLAVIIVLSAFVFIRQRRM